MPYRYSVQYEVNGKFTSKATIPHVTCEQYFLGNNGKPITFVMSNIGNISNFIVLALQKNLNNVLSAPDICKIMFNGEISFTTIIYKTTITATESRISKVLTAEREPDI